MTQTVNGIRRIVNGVVCIECPQCGTDYDRELVIAEIKKQSPFLFDFGGWTTKFICQVCNVHIIISSSNDNKVNPRKESSAHQEQMITQSKEPKWENLTNEELLSYAKDLGLSDCLSLSRGGMIKLITEQFNHEKLQGGSKTSTLFRKWWHFWKPAQ